MFLVLLTTFLGGCMLTWTEILLEMLKLLTPDAPHLAVRGLYVSITGGAVSIFFLVRLSMIVVYWDVR